MNKLFFAIIIIFCFNSCDILRSSRFEVVSWSPGCSFISEPKDAVVALFFSHEPDMASVERHFSLTEDGSRVRGTFFWEGKKMIFVPLVPLEKNMDYILNLSADAHDTEGLSMDSAFGRNFSTRAGGTRPILLSCYPQMYAEIDDARTEVRLCFSVPIALNTLYDSVSFSPSMTGFWSLEDDGNTAVFTPAEPWMLNKRYEIHLSTALTDNNRMNIGKDFVSVFTIGTDHEIPYLLYAGRITEGGSNVRLDIDTGGYISAAKLPVENDGWEKNDKLFLAFSKPVDGLSVKNYLNVEGVSGLVMETAPGYKTEFVFRFETVPVYESRFVFRLKPGVKDDAGNESGAEYIYRIFANGKHSKPPALAGIRIPMAPGSETNREFLSFSTDMPFENIPITEGGNNYPSGETIKTWIELYFAVADGASIDPFSVMELFRIETSNNVLTFSPRQIKTDNFSVSTPQIGWENLQRIEIMGNLVNSINFGIVNFQISSGLTDSKGNKNEKLQRISVLK